MRHLPLARELQRLSRQQLVTRLEAYNSGALKPTFRSVLALLEREALPLLRQGGISGRAEWSSDDGTFASCPDAVAMVVDVLSDRGFLASYARESVIVPVRFDAATGRVESESRPVHRFTIRFEGTGEGSHQAALKAMEIAARMAEAKTATATSVAGATAARGSYSGPMGTPAACGASSGCAEAAQIAQRALQYGSSSGAGGSSDDVAGCRSPVTMSFLPQHLLEREARLCAEQVALEQRHEQEREEQQGWEEAEEEEEAAYGAYARA